MEQHANCVVSRTTEKRKTQSKLKQKQKQPRGRFLTNSHTHNSPPADPQLGDGDGWRKNGIGIAVVVGVVW